MSSAGRRRWRKAAWRRADVGRSAATGGGRERLRHQFAVSRETLTRLDVYEALLRRWQGAINLVARSTLDDPWTRHFLDSAQLLPLLPPECRVLVDLGSGAGFPGLVLSILGVPEVHLIESDRRKAIFLGEVIRATAATATVHAARIEEVEPFPADAVTARALAPLDELLAYAHPFIGAEGTALLPKGRQVEEELTRAGSHWTMRVERFDSVTEPRTSGAGSILRLSRIFRA